jgi:hypothetical protein
MTSDEPGRHRLPTVGEAADQIADAVNNAVLHAPRLAAEAARKESRRWYLWVLPVVLVIPLAVSVWTARLTSIDHDQVTATREQVVAQKAAWDAIHQRAATNLAAIRAQIDTINRTALAPRHLPLVPLPTDPITANASLGLAQMFAQLPPTGAGEVRMGQPPVSWTVQNMDRSVTTCGRTVPFAPERPTYTCRTTLALPLLGPAAN